MVGELPAKADGVSCGTSIAEKRVLTVRVGWPVVDRFVRRFAGGQLAARQNRQFNSGATAWKRLTSVFYVAYDTVIGRPAHIIEIAIVVPVHIAVGIEIPADN